MTVDEQYGVANLSRGDTSEHMDTHEPYEPIPYVLGIDPSLTGTGVARIYKDGTVFVNHFGRKGRRNETLIDRAARVRFIMQSVTGWIYGANCWGLAVNSMGETLPVLTVIEAPSHGSRGGSAWDRAYLWWELVNKVAVDRVATCVPATRAKWATGTGRSDKAAVSAAVARLWPLIELDCSDCADALALATIGAQHLGWDVPRLARHESCLAVVKWPVANEDEQDIG